MKTTFLNHPSFLLKALLLLPLAVPLIRSQGNNSAAPSPSASSPSNPPSTSLPPTPSSEPTSPSQPTETSLPTSTNPPPSTPTNPPPSSSPSNNNPVSPSNPPSNSQSNLPPSQSSLSLPSPRPSSGSSGSPAQTIPGGSSQPASSVVIITVTRTGADGQVYTSLASSYTPLPRPTSSSNNSSAGSGSSANTWAIIGGIVGGLAGIGAIVFIVFRCTQRRFSDLDDEDVAIKWPELVNRAEDPSTLNPLAARPGIGHGIGEDDGDEKPRLYSHDIAMESLHSDQRHPAVYDTYQAYPPPPPPHPQEHGGYSDDPYLGPSVSQQSYPGTLSHLGYDEQLGYNHHHQQQQRSHELHSQPSLGSSVGPPQHDPTASPRSASRQHNLNPADHHHQQYPIAWDGPEDIPLTVVNNQQAPPTPLHNPYQKP